MNHLLLLSLLAIALSPFEPSRAPAPGEIQQDDGLVLRAVLEHTIVPEHRRTNAGAEPLKVVSETSPLCVEPPAGQSQCRIPEHWRQFLEPNAARSWPGVVSDERIRRDLVASLEARNTKSHPLPLSTFPGIGLLDLRKDPPANPLDRHYRRKMGASSLSLPGYAGEDHALVYGSYSCGDLCGYGWLFVLEKLQGQWRVKSATVTVIS